MDPNTLTLLVAVAAAVVGPTLAVIAGWMLARKQVTRSNLQGDYERLTAEFDRLKADYTAQLNDLRTRLHDMERKYDGARDEIAELKEKLRHPPVAPQPTGPAPPAAPGVGGAGRDAAAAAPGAVGAKP